MTTSRKASLKSVISREDTQLLPAQIGYFVGRAQSIAHEAVMRTFLSLNSENKSINRAFVARRLGKKPEQITRWMSSPGNMTINTYTSLLIALGHEPTFGSKELLARDTLNEHHILCGSQYTAGSAQQKALFAVSEANQNKAPGLLSTAPTKSKAPEFPQPAQQLAAFC